MDVELVRWPEEESRLDALRHARTPRLVLVREGVAPPDPPDEYEDWIRMPSSDSDVRLRIATLLRRLAGESRPVLDDGGLIRFRDRWTSLPPVEYRLTAALVDRYGAVVSREALARAGWPEGAPGRNALDVHVVRLRRRLAAVGLAIRTVRSRGYLLEPLQVGAETRGA